jgi:hypothetical protein
VACREAGLLAPPFFVFGARLDPRVFSIREDRLPNIVLTKIKIFDA